MTYIIFCILAFVPQIFLGLLFKYDWNQGELRGAIVVILLGALLAFRFGPRLSLGDHHGPAPMWIYALMLAGGMFVAVDGAQTIARVVATGAIPMDEGQTTWRASRLLWRGENPYGAGALVDHGAIVARAEIRREAGIGPAPEGAALVAALGEYDKSLDPAERRALLPEPVAPSYAASRETRFGGYKYGPAILMLTTPLAIMGWPAAVVVFNQTLCLGLFWTMWKLMRGVTGDVGFAALGVTALLFDQHILWNFVHGAATDVWPLLWGALAVLATQAKRPYLVATALAIAVAGKIFPSLMFTPLLLTFRATKPICVFVGLVGLFYLPFLIADPMGFIDNVWLWPLYMSKDTTSWQYYAPPIAGLAVRVAALMGIAALWIAYLAGRETRLFWTLATLHAILLLTPGAFHNNYVPWVSIWVIAALVEAIGAPMGALPQPTAASLELAKARQPAS